MLVYQRVIIIMMIYTMDYDGDLLDYSGDLMDFSGDIVDCGSG